MCEPNHKKILEKIRAENGIKNALDYNYYCCHFAVWMFEIWSVFCVSTMDGSEYLQNFWIVGHVPQFSHLTWFLLGNFNFPVRCCFVRRGLLRGFFIWLEGSRHALQHNKSVERFSCDRRELKNGFTIRRFDF